MFKVCLGIPLYGPQEKDFWQPLVNEVSTWNESGIELTASFAVGGMMTDLARNKIAAEFLNTKAEWLLWVDADNATPIGEAKRLLASNRTLITGVYVKKYGAPEPTIYQKTRDGLYQSIDNYRKGEILPIDGAGLGGCLCHRSVFEDTRRNYRLFEATSEYRVIHKDDIQGEILDVSKDTDGKVINGVLCERLRLPKQKHDFPFFILQGGRTEDYGFFERAARSGHPLWCDTSVELGHVGLRTVKVDDWREIQRQKEKSCEFLP